MIEFTWKVFSQTGSIDTYLLMKEIEKEHQETDSRIQSELSEADSSLTS